jgi:hypothetical protein
MNGQRKAAPLEGGGDESQLKTKRRDGKNTQAVPPPALNEIDALVDAVSAGGRPRPASEIDHTTEFVSEDSLAVAAPSRDAPPARTLFVFSGIARIVAASAAAFALGVLIAWVVVRSFDTPPVSVATNPPAGAESTTPAAPPPAPAPSTATTPSTPVASPAAASPPVSPAVPTPAIETGRTPIRATEAVATPPAPRIPAEPARTAAVPEPVVPPIAVPVPLPAPSVVTAPPVVPAPPPVAPAVAAPAAAPPAVAAASRAAAAVDQTAVIEAVQEYAQAYGAMDVSAAAAVWPSVDRRALARAFGTLKSQELELGNCEVTIAEGSATARCRGTVAYVRKVGDQTPRTGRQEWVFKMRKIGDEWIIDTLDASPIAALESGARRGAI